MNRIMARNRLDSHDEQTGDFVHAKHRIDHGFARNEPKSGDSRQGC